MQLACTRVVTPWPSYYFTSQFYIFFFNIPEETWFSRSDRFRGNFLRLTRCQTHRPGAKTPALAETPTLNNGSQAGGDRSGWKSRAPEGDPKTQFALVGYRVREEKVGARSGTADAAAVMRAVGQAAAAAGGSIAVGGGTPGRIRLRVHFRVASILTI